MALLPHGESNSIDTTKLIRLYYKARGMKEQFNGRIVVTSLIRRIGRKLEADEDSEYVIVKSEMSGPHPQEVWLEKKK